MPFGISVKQAPKDKVGELVQAAIDGGGDRIVCYPTRDANQDWQIEIYSV